jgi:hypothetical protein
MRAALAQAMAQGTFAAAASPGKNFAQIFRPAIHA